MPVIDVTRTYLEIVRPGDLRPAPVPPGDVRLLLRRPCAVERYRWLYREVGEPWQWHDRNFWSNERLAEHLGSPVVAIWELEAEGDTAGYFELQRHAAGDVEIAYFGLRPGFSGRGLGGYMLTRAVEEAFAMGASRVWLHTCTLDSPAALPNYRARGFRETATERYTATLPDT